MEEWPACFTGASDAHCILQDAYLLQQIVSTPILLLRPLLPLSDLILYRRRSHGSFHLKLDRNDICPFPPLSILLMVCPTNTLSRLEDLLSMAFEVSIQHFVLFIIWHLFNRLALILGIEYAWNIFPSTPISSGILLTCNVLLLAGIWFGYPTGKRWRFFGY